jgi:hypothetical protein
MFSCFGEELTLQAELWVWLITCGLIIGLLRCVWVSYQRFLDRCLLIVDVPLSLSEFESPECRMVI